jgi:hypothetical protein
MTLEVLAGEFDQSNLAVVEPHRAAIISNFLAGILMERELDSELCPGKMEARNN